MNWEVWTMQSKRSFFNGTLFRKTLTRFWPLWAVPSFIGALFPMVALTQLIRYAERMEPLEVTEIYYHVVHYAVPFISLVYAVLVAAAVWSYLYNSRSVGMMHTLPLDRKGLFATGVLSGMAMMLIPYVVTGGLAIVIFVCFGGFDPVGTLVTILAVIGHSLFYFASATAVAFVTGNLFALPVLYFIFHFLVVGLDALVNLFANGFIFGLNTGYSGVLEFLSPTVYLVSHMGVDTTYNRVYHPERDDLYGYYSRELTSVTLENGWLIAVYALVGLVLLGIAYALYRKRRSESAGDVVAVGWMKPVFRYGVAFCSAMAGGLGLYFIFWGSFQSGDSYDVLPLAIAMLIAGAIGYYTASMLLAKSLRVFRGSWKGLGVTALCAIALCCVLHFDLLGIETRVPEVSQVKSVTFYAADNNYTFDPETEAELLEEVRAVHRAIAEDAAYIRAMDRNWTTGGEDDYREVSGYNTVRLNYELKNGATVSRRYTVPMTMTRLQDETTYDYALNALVNGEAMKAKRFHLDDPMAPYGGYIYLEKQNDGSVSFGNREALAVLEGIRKDVAEGTCGNYDWFGLSYGSAYAMDLDLEFHYQKVDSDGDDYTDHDYIGITVRPEMVHTVAALLEQKLVTEDDLVTRAELYPEQYLEEQAYLREMAEKYGAYDRGVEALTSAPTPTQVIVGSSEAASIGIIGGADGPTTIMVSGG